MYTLPLPHKMTGKYGNNEWFVYSPKLKRDVHLYSDLEYDNWVLVETNSNIKTFCEQPKEIEITMENEIVKSIFDMWICLTDGTQEFHEVKYEKDIDPNREKSLRAIRQTSAQRQWCLKNEIPYSIQTEKNIRGNEVFLENMKVIIPYIAQRETAIETDLFHIGNIIQSDPISIKQIITDSPDIPVPRIRESVYRMIYQGTVSSNVNLVPIGIKTEVWKNG